MARPFLAAVGLVFVAHSYAWAQNPVQLTTSSDLPGNWKKLEGTTAEVSAYLGSGSFYTSGYTNDYASLALFLKPSYDLGTRYKLAVRARILLEQELTQPDNPTGRHFQPYDPWVWLAADNLRTFERSKIRIGGSIRTIWPLSYESRYRHDVITVGMGPNVNRDFDFGDLNDEARKWSLKLGYGVMAYKYFHSSDFRGSGPGDTTGCLAPASPGAPGAASAGGPSASSADLCGGPANTNFSFTNAFFATLARGKASVTMSLQIFNDFKYAFPADAVTADNAAVRGRSDGTWGIIALSYKLRPHLSLGFGVSSMQPALDSRYQYPRFPFWDFSGGNANNFSQMFFSVGGSL